MKKKNLNFLLELLAALALVFAAGCDTGTNGGSSSGADDDPEEVLTDNAVYIAAVLDAITGTVTSGIEDVEWAFQAGAGSEAESGWDQTNLTYTLLLSSSSRQSSTDRPVLNIALAGVKELDTATDSTNGITINFSGATESSSNQAAAGNQYDYLIAVPVTVGGTNATITLALGYSTVSSESNGWMALVTADHVELLLQSIGDDAVRNVETTGDFWLFGSGSLSLRTDPSDVYVFSVADAADGSNATSQADPDYTLSAMESVGTEGTLTADGNPCEITFSSLSWDSGRDPDDDSANPGAITVTVEIADDYADDYEFPDDDAALQSVTIEFTATNSQGWADD